MYFLPRLPNWGFIMSINRDQFLKLFIRDYSLLRAYVWQRLYNDDLVEETLQEFAITAIGKLSEIRNEEHFPGWARTTCRYLAMNARSKQQRRPMIMLSNEVLDMLEGEWEKFEVADHQNRMSALRKCLSKLAPYARRLIEMRYAKNLRFRQIAEILGQNKNTVSSAVARIHRFLGNCIEKDYSPE
jgi:RNA polymerase sigma factor (sigma-70 family)